MISNDQSKLIKSILKERTKSKQEIESSLKYYDNFNKRQSII